jgi:hypothetical protein
VPTVQRRHYLTRSIALDFPRRIASRARNLVAVMGDVFVTQSNRSWRRLDDPIGRRLVAVQNQISFQCVSEVYRNRSNLIQFDDLRCDLPIIGHDASSRTKASDRCSSRRRALTDFL